MNGTHQALRAIDDGGLHHESHVPVANDVSATHQTALPQASAGSADSKDETQICAKAKSSPEPDPLSGRVIGGRFEVRESLGDSGLGRLLCAYDRRAERTLSLRIVRCADVASRLGAYVAEVAGLTHPGLLPVIGVLRSPAPVASAAHADEGSAMIVQAGLEGRSVARQLEANRQRGEHKPPEEAYRIIAELAAALDAVNGSGPHGAVGPETVWIDDQGKAVLTDLVLSRVVLSHDCLNGEGRTARRTLFLSPEVKRGATPERASDVYGLSALFYALVTGRLPDERAVDPSSLRAELTGAFDAVLRRGLASQPDERYPSPDILCVALLDSVREAEQQRRHAQAHKVQASVPASETAEPPALASPPVSAAVEPAPFKPSSPRSKTAPDKFNVALLLNVPANQTKPHGEQPNLTPPAADESKVEQAKPAPTFAKVAFTAAKTDLARPAPPVLQRPAVSPAKRATLGERPASPPARGGISTKLALVKAKAQVDRATLPPVPALASLMAAHVAPAPEQQVAAQSPSGILPPPLPASPVVETSATSAVDAPAAAIAAPAAAIAAPAAAIAAPTLATADAPAAAIAAPTLATADAPAATATDETEPMDILPLSAMDTLLVPAAAVATERPRMPLLQTWVTTSKAWITTLRSGITTHMPANALAWLPSQASVLHTLQTCRRVLLSASERVTRWGAEVAAQGAWRRINRSTQLLLGAWLVFALSVSVLLLARAPAEHGEALLRARAEVSAVEHHFDPREAERSLTEQARAQGQVSLVVEVPVYAKRRRPTTESQTLSVAPLTEVKLKTLAQMEAHALPGSTVTVYAPDVAALASSISWRLRRRAALDAVTLEQVDLFWADVSEQDADLELLVPTLRERSLEAKRALSGSRRVVDRLSASRPNRTPTKGAYAKAPTAQRAPAFARAGRVLRERRKVSQEAQASYEEAAQRAERYTLKLSTPEGVAKVAAARVTVRFGLEKETLDVPVRVHPAEVSIAPPVGVGFGATHAAGTWDAVKNKTPQAAVVTLASLVPWQTRAIGMMKTLSCLFFGLICVLSFRMIRPETRKAWASNVRSVALAAYEHLRTLVARLRTR